MKHPLAHTIAATCLALAGFALPSARAATGLVNFDLPTTPQGPRIFVAVPGPQTIVTPEASFALFNGETFLQSYVVNAFNGSTQVASQAANNILPNFNSGFALVDMVNAGGITSVTIHAVNPPGVRDFLIDTVAFNQSISSVVPNAPPPPITLPPVTVTYTEPDTIDVHGHKQKGKTKTVLNQVINYGDDLNDAKGHFEALPSPVPESSTAVLTLVGLAAAGQVSLRRRRHGSAR